MLTRNGFMEESFGTLSGHLETGGFFNLPFCRKNRYYAVCRLFL